MDQRQDLIVQSRELEGHDNGLEVMYTRDFSHQNFDFCLAIIYDKNDITVLFRYPKLHFEL